MQTRETPAVLIFTLGARHERRRRRLLPPALGRWELELHRQGLEAAVAAARGGGCRVVVSSPGDAAEAGDVEHVAQVGRCFGERLRRSLAELERRWPAAPRVVVGTDVPGLEAHHVRAALGQLERDPRRVVVGPSPDGGFYLLAARQPLDAVLARVRWRRRDTLRSLLAALAAAGLPVGLLPSLADLDRRSDLERWLARRPSVPARWRRLRAALRELLAARRRPAAPRALGRVRQALALVPAGRAPPA